MQTNMHKSKSRNARLLAGLLTMTSAGAAAHAMFATSTWISPNVVIANPRPDAFATVLRAYSRQEIALPAEPNPDALSFPLSIDGRTVNILVARRSLRAADYRVHVDHGAGGIDLAPPPPVRTYRGQITGEPNSRVHLSISKRGVTGRITSGGQSWYVQPACDFDKNARAADHVVYQSSDAIADGRHCDDATALALNPAPSVGGIAGGPSSGGNINLGGEHEGGYYNVRIAFEVDYDFYLHHDSDVPAIIDWVESHMNTVDSIYEGQVGICYTIGDIFIRSGPLPAYDYSNASLRLNGFKDWWNANQAGVARDLAHMLTGQDIDGGTIGLAKNPGIRCSNDNAYGFSQDLGVGGVIYTHSRQVELIAHEIGHNWNAEHTNCGIMNSSIASWPAEGRNDFCSESEEAIIAWRDQYASCRFVSCGCGDWLYVDSSSELLDRMDDADCNSEIWIDGGNYSVSYDELNAHVTLDAVNGDVILQP